MPARWARGSVLASWGRRTPTCAERNQFATLTDLGLAALLWRQASSPSGLPQSARSRGQYRRARHRPRCWLWARRASNSRTGLLQLVLASPCSVLWQRKNVPWLRSPAGRLLLVAGGAYCLAAWLLPGSPGLQPGASGIVARLQDVSITCQSRSVLWANVWHLVLQKPWLGWGWGELDYAHFITLYPGARFCDILDNAHNLPLQLAVELGLPFALGACGVLLWWVLRSAPWKNQPGRQLAWAVLGLVGVHSMLEYPLWYGPFQMASATALLLLWQAPIAQPAATPSFGLSPVVRRAPLARPWAWAVGCGSALVLALCVLAVVDYWRMTQLYLPIAQRAPAYREDTLHKLQGIVFW